VDKARLSALLASVRVPHDPRVLVGTATSDDAGVVRLTPELALVQTVDFFPPMVDDPEWFGRVAAANSLSDVYAMGGTPLSAVSILGLPDGLAPEVAAAILNGAIATCQEAGCSFVGGHTVSDREVKFGLCVTGTVHPQHVATNAGAQPGDRLVLTKPLGSGYLNTAVKRGDLPAEMERALAQLMSTLNRAAAEAMQEVGIGPGGVHAATDVTGFGLLGHALGMAEASGTTFRVQAADVPWIPGLSAWLGRKYACGGLARNMDYAEGRVQWSGGTDEQRAVLADPQTSGGLLVSVAPARLGALLAALERRGVATRAVVGEVRPRATHPMEVA
jgi:selenide,water dikinase